MCVQYIGGCSVHRGITMSTLGDILSTSGNVQYIGGISWFMVGGQVDKSVWFILKTPMYSWYPPRASWYLPDVLMISPDVLMVYPDALMVSPRCTEHSPMYWTHIIQGGNLPILSPSVELLHTWVGEQRRRQWCGLRTVLYIPNPGIREGGISLLALACHLLWDKEKIIESFQRLHDRVIVCKDVQFFLALAIQSWRKQCNSRNHRSWSS